MTHTRECIGLHTNCTECSDGDNLNVCMSEFGGAEVCTNHEVDGA